MKIGVDRKKREFTPVTITITFDTEYEIRSLSKILGEKIEFENLYNTLNNLLSSYED